MDDGGFLRGSALHEAARRGQTDCVVVLCDALADVNMRDVTSDTPLHCDPPLPFNAVPHCQRKASGSCIGAGLRGVAGAKQCENARDAFSPKHERKINVCDHTCMDAASRMLEICCAKP